VVKNHEPPVSQTPQKKELRNENSDQAKSEQKSTVDSDKNTKRMGKPDSIMSLRSKTAIESLTSFVEYSKR
jgi:hypothetical protein